MISNNSAKKCMSMGNIICVKKNTLNKSFMHYNIQRIPKFAFIEILYLQKFIIMKV